MKPPRVCLSGEVLAPHGLRILYACSAGTVDAFRCERACMHHPNSLDGSELYVTGPRASSAAWNGAAKHGWERGLVYIRA